MFLFSFVISCRPYFRRYHSLYIYGLLPYSLPFYVFCFTGSHHGLLSLPICLVLLYESVFLILCCFYSCLRSDTLAYTFSTDERRYNTDSFYFLLTLLEIDPRISCVFVVFMKKSKKEKASLNISMMLMKGKKGEKEK